MAKRLYKPSFKIKERVLIDGELLTVKGMSWCPKNRIYSYDIEGRPNTFFFESELEKNEEANKNGEH